MALPSEIPLAAHVLIKHQREHAFSFPSVTTAISSTSVWLSCFQVEHFHTRPNEELFICSQLSVFSKSRTLKGPIFFESFSAELEGVGGKEARAFSLQVDLGVFAILITENQLLQTNLLLPPICSKNISSSFKQNLQHGRHHSESHCYQRHSAAYCQGSGKQFSEQMIVLVFLRIEHINPMLGKQN